MVRAGVRPFETSVPGAPAVPPWLPNPETGFRIEASVNAGKVSLATGGREPAVTLEDLRFDGDVESDESFSAFTLHKGRFEWGDFFATGISGEFQKPDAGDEFSFVLESDECWIAPLIERILSIKLDDLLPPGDEKSPPLELLADITGGSVRFNARAAGRMSEPDRMAVLGNGRLLEFVWRHIKCS